jgi:serine protease Do
MRKHFLIGFCCFGLVLGLLLIRSHPSETLIAAELDVAKTIEQERVKVVNKVKPAVVAVFARGGRGGGSGVVIDPEGYALTNYHVTSGCGNFMQAGLPDGILYDAVIVGQDKVGDVALIKLIPKKDGDKFPFVPLGDSDNVKAGDWSLAMGNPFLLATDFTPSVSFGLVSGVNRYQYPEGQFLEYTDCIQFDTTINPGNSGGPLFNMNAELIGINGRGSFAQDKRFRINCGVGYAISINQIKNFLGHLYAGIDADHATLGAAVRSADEEANLSQMVVREVLDDSDAYRRGLQEGDELIFFAGRSIRSVNQYKNILGIYPKDWRLPLVYRRGEREKKETLVRLQGYQSVIVEPKQPNQPPRPEAKDPGIKPPPSSVTKLFKERKGYANYYFNELAQKALLEKFKKLGDFSAVGGGWTIEGTFAQEGRNGQFTSTVTEVKDNESKSTKPVSTLQINDVVYTLQPLKGGESVVNRSEPPNSGGLVMAFYHLHRFFTVGPKGFEGNNFVHGGYEPFYPMPLDNSKPADMKDVRVMSEVIHTEHAGIACKWYFFKADLNPQMKSPVYQDGMLLGFETFISPKEIDPCEIYFSDYRAVDGRQLPHKMEVRHGDKRYALLTVNKYRLGETPK